ncbi:MAG: glycosyltransferase [bacterium]|nr:glycosyltransferase [bacterium]
MNPTVSLSVLMPVYNEAYTVGECIRRVLAVRSAFISEIEIIVVDDGSTDGSRDILRRLAARHPEIILIEQPTNRGKGEAIRTALAKASKDICIIQDADLEYNPKDYEKLIIPFVREQADAVFGSRFLVGDYCRLLYFRHALVNRFLTTLADLITDVNYTDIETCYKAVRTRLLKSIPIRSHGFDLEPELSVKLAKRRAAIFEVPISYAGRTKEEGKKIGWWDGVVALWTLIKYWLIDDIYQEDEYGSAILHSLAQAPNFCRWMAETIRPYVGDYVLEIGAGLGNLTSHLIPRPHYVVSDINQNYLDYLKNYCLYKPYMEVKTIDLRREEDFIPYREQFDTVICLNVLEHIEDDLAGLKNIHQALRAEGRAIVLVPYGEWLRSSFDEVLGHYRRYSDLQLQEVMKKAGFDLVKIITSFNRIGVPAWILNGKILRRKKFSSIQIKILNTFQGILSKINTILPWHGLSTIAIGRKR